jgi:hypothetical protein
VAGNITVPTRGRPAGRPGAHPDGKARNLRFTEISGPTVVSQPESHEDDFVAAVKRVLNKITVRSAAGGTKLAYTSPTGGSRRFPSSRRGQAGERRLISSFPSRSRTSYAG